MSKPQSTPRRLCNGLVAALLTALAGMFVTVAAQTVTHPTPAQRAAHQAHVQHLKNQQRSRNRQRQIRQRTQKTARKAYQQQPRLQKHMKQASDARQKQSHARDGDLQRRLHDARVPQPVTVSSQPAPAQS